MALKLVFLSILFIASDARRHSLSIEVCYFLIVTFYRPYEVPYTGCKSKELSSLIWEGK